MKKFVLLTTVTVCCLSSSCDLVGDVLNTDTVTGNLYYWVTSDADSYVECTTIGGGCTGGDFDHSGYDFVSVAHTPLSIKRAYINFPKMNFPPGTLIEEAYFEMYHGGKNEDGKPDDILLDVNRIRTSWDAGKLTYSNQPIPTGNGGEFYLKLESQNWSGTTDISRQLQEEIITNQTFEGFLISIQNFSPGYEKGLYSGNHRSRTLNDLGLAPRLLLRVKLPAGSTVQDVSFGPGHADGKGGYYVGYRYRTGGSWPGDWNLANQN